MNDTYAEAKGGGQIRQLEAEWKVMLTLRKRKVSRLVAIIAAKKRHDGVDERKGH
jgi:hypothetical protein